MLNRFINMVLVGLLIIPVNMHANISDQDSVRTFISEISSKHGFDQNWLIQLFQRVEVTNSVLQAISRPAEAMPWFKYRPIFLRDDRIRQGVEFIQENRGALLEAEKKFGVPPEIITAIIGVETRYGRNAGNYRVLDSLATLAFYYPKRADFFRAELEQFLLLAREEGLDPLEVKGSYAGAMGIPQFISSSFRHYAVDFNNDGHIDIWDNTTDAIGSVGNYFKLHGWRNGGLVTMRVQAAGDRYKLALTDGLRPDLEISSLPEFGISARFDGNFGERKVKLLSFELEKGSELWLGFENFYVITRYNHSPLYAMAVYQLAGEIAKAYQQAMSL